MKTINIDVFAITVLLTDGMDIVSLYTHFPSPAFPFDHLKELLF